MSTFHAAIGQAGYGRLMVLNDVSLAVDSGSMLVILGSNGAGKTTTLHAIMGNVVTKDRAVSLDGSDLSRLATWQLPHQGVVLVPDGARCFPNLTVLENLRGAYEAGGHGRKLPPAGELLEEVYGYFPILRERREQLAGTLSGGQRQMLAVGRALMTRPKTLLLDEPSAGLAPKVVEELFLALAEVKQRSGCGIVMAEQNVGYATRVADTCIVLEEGRTVLSGSMAEVVENEKLRTAYLGL